MNLIIELTAVINFSGNSLGIFLPMQENYQKDIYFMIIKFNEKFFI